MRNAILLVAVVFGSLASTSRLAAEEGSITCGAPYTGTDNGFIVVATIARVLDDRGTNGNPPRLQIEVEQVLRGELKPNRYLAIWSPPPHDIDYGDVVTNPRYIQWKAVPLIAPKVDTKWVLWGELLPASRTRGNVPVFWVNPFHRYVYSDERRAWAIQEILDGKQRQIDIEKQRALEEKQRQADLKVWQAWQASPSPSKVGPLTNKADVVAVVRTAGYSIDNDGKTTFSFCILKLLKGNFRKPFVEKMTFVSVSAEAKLTQLFRQRMSELGNGQWILFLANTKQVPSDNPYKPEHFLMLDNDIGLFPAEKPYLEAVEKALAP